jgi:hypothetical protein
MHTNIMTSIRACNDESNLFFIKIRLRQESTLNSYIFTLMMDEIKNDIQRDIFWYILFVDDIVLIDEDMIGVDKKTSIVKINFRIKIF